MSLTTAVNSVASGNYVGAAIALVSGAPDASQNWDDNDWGWFIHNVSDKNAHAASVFMNWVGSNPTFVRDVEGHSRQQIIDRMSGFGYTSQITQIMNQIAPVQGSIFSGTPGNTASFFNNVSRSAPIYSGSAAPVVNTGTGSILDNLVKTTPLFNAGANPTYQQKPAATANKSKSMFYVLIAGVAAVIGAIFFFKKKGKK